MTTPAWTLAVALGHAGMDAEHSVELALMDALRDAVARDLGPNRVQEVLDQLLEHSNVHFMSEQLLMRLTAYPQYEAHALEHDELMSRARALQDRVAGVGTPGSLEAIDEMRRWLVEHMERKDRALAGYLAEHGRPAPSA